MNFISDYEAHKRDEEWDKAEDRRASRKPQTKETDMSIKKHEIGHYTYWGIYSNEVCIATFATYERALEVLGEYL